MSAAARLSQADLPRKFARYFAGGLAGVVVYYGVLMLLCEVAGAPVALGAFGAWSVAATFSYFVNYYFAFQSHEKHGVALSKYSLIQVLNVAVNVTMMHYIVAVMALPYLVGVLAFGIVVVLINFSLYYLWTFRQ